MKDRSPQTENLDYFGLSSLWTGLPSFTAQPPLPLQVFFPAHPLSPDLQPPLPLQVFLPAQSWVSPFSFSTRTPAETPALSAFATVAALTLVTKPPEMIPARAAPARSVLLVV